MKCMEFNKADQRCPNGAEDNAVCTESQPPKQGDGSSITDEVGGGEALSIAATVGSAEGNQDADEEHKASRSQTTHHNQANVTLAMEIGHRRNNSTTQSMLEFAVRDS